MKTALITGGAKRVGKSMVEHLASKGWNVIIHANRSIQDAQELVHLLSSNYESQFFDAVSFNLKDWRNASQFIDDLLKKHKKLDLLINNASKYSPGNLEQTEENLLEEMTAIHYYSPLLMSKQLVSNVKEALIVNVLDAAIVNNHTEHSAYLLAKKNLAEFTKMSAVEWAPNVRVNAIAPGPVLPIVDKDDNAFEEVVARTPLQIPVDLHSFLKTLDFILGNNNITGQILFCDSGQHLR